MDSMEQVVCRVLERAKASTEQMMFSAKNSPKHRKKTERSPQFILEKHFAGEKWFLLKSRR